MVFHVEVDYSGFPVVAGLGQEGGNQAQEGGFVGEDAGDAGAAFEFLVDAFQRIGGAHPWLVGGRQREHREALRQIFLQPGRQFGRGFGVVGDELLEPLFGGEATRALEYATDGAGDFGALIQTRDVSLSVLLEVELAALPGDGAKDGLARRGHAGVIVADQQRLSEGDELRDGGAAMTAYARMQFEEMAERERQEIRAALLRYCELDTLAMVVIYEAWRDLIEQTKAK